jgi:hypothetical protein
MHGKLQGSLQMILDLRQSLPRELLEAPFIRRLDRKYTPLLAASDFSWA